MMLVLTTAVIVPPVDADFALAVTLLTLALMPLLVDSLLLSSLLFIINKGPVDGPYRDIGVSMYAQERREARSL